MIKVEQGVVSWWRARQGGNILREARLPKTLEATMFTQPIDKNGQIMLPSFPKLRYRSDGSLQAEYRERSAYARN